MKTILSALLSVALLGTQAHAASSPTLISAFPEKFALSTNDVFVLSTPGIGTYKATLITIASNLSSYITVAATVTNAIATGSNISPTNSTVFGVYSGVSGLTNLQFFSLKTGTNIVLTRDGSNIVINTKPNVSYQAGVNEMVIGTWGNVFGISNSVIGRLSLSNQDPGAGDDWYFAGSIYASNANFATLPGTGDYVMISPGGILGRTNGGVGEVTTAQLNIVSNLMAKNLTGFATNLTVRLGLSMPSITANRPLFINASGNITNVSGTPDGTKYVRDDGTLATPAGSGDVTTAQLNTSSNDLYSIETTRNGAVSNAVASLVVANDNTTSNALRSAASSGLTNKIENLNGFGTNTTIVTSLTVAGTVNVSTNLYVTNLVTSQQFDTVNFNANTMVLTNAIGSNVVRLGRQDLTNHSINPFVIAGTGSGSSNFAMVATQPEAIINAAASVSVRAVTGGNATKVDRWTLVATNGSGADQGIEFASTNNTWRWPYGAPAPSLITNLTQIKIEARQMGTNILASFHYFPWP